MEPLVFISILNWNERELLQQCLDTLLEINYENIEIVVVDNGSTDGSVEMVENQFSSVQTITNDHNRGYSKANNQVLNMAVEKGADYVLLLNNDVIINDKDFLSTMVNVSERKKDIGVVGCNVIEPDGTTHYDGRYFPRGSIFPILRGRYQYNRYQRDSPPKGNYEYIDDVVGAVYLIKTDVVREIGLLDERYSPAYYEESDYSVRVWNGGFKIVHTDQAVVQHIRGQTSSKIDDAYLEYVQQRNRIRFIFTNYPASWILLGIPGLLFKLFLFFITIDSGIGLRSDFIKNPRKYIYYALQVVIDTIISLPEFISMRNERKTINKLLK